MVAGGRWQGGEGRRKKEVAGPHLANTKSGHGIAESESIMHPRSSDTKRVGNSRIRSFSFSLASNPCVTQSEKESIHHEDDR